MVQKKDFQTALLQLRDELDRSRGLRGAATETLAYANHVLAQAHATRWPRGGCRILIVADDHEPSGQALSDLGFVVEIVPSAAAARAITHAFDPAIVLVDLAHETDGFALPHQLRAYDHAIALVAITDDVEHARGCGFTGHISRPFEVARLVQIVDELAA